MTSHTIASLRRIKREIERIQDNTDPTKDEPLTYLILAIDKETGKAIAYLDGKTQP